MKLVNVNNKRGLTAGDPKRPKPIKFGQRDRRALTASNTFEIKQGSSLKKILFLKRVVPNTVLKLNATKGKVFKGFEGVFV